MGRTRPIVIRLAVIAAALAGAFGAYSMGTFVSPTAATFTTGGIELTIDSKAFYNKLAYPKSTWSAKDLKPYYDRFFDFKDVKPGDTGTTTISLHIKKASAYACLTFDDFKDSENGQNEPEKPTDPTTTLGELGKGVEFFAWYDDGDNKFEVGEKPLFGTTTQSAIQTVKNKTYALADYAHGSAWLDGSTHYVGIAWCAGNMSVNLAAAKVGCDAAALGNDAQTDSLSFSVALSAVSSTQDKKYLCGPKPDNHEHDHDKDEICHHTGDKKKPTQCIEVEHGSVSSYLKKYGDYVVETRDDEERCKRGDRGGSGH